MSSKEGNWFNRHKVLTTILAFVLLIIVVSTFSSDSSNDSSNTASNESGGEKSYRFNDRADKQEKDVEVAVNEPATVDGVKMTITKITKKTAIDEFETAEKGKTFVIADVVLENVSEDTKPYNVFDFRIQTQSGEVLDGAFATVKKPLSSGDLVTSGKTSGQIVFEAPIEKGNQYIIWKPNPVESDRAIVQVK